MATEQHSGDVYGPPIEGSHPTIQSDRRAWARDRVRVAANNRGKPPSSFLAADIEWAFGTSDEAVAELEQLEQQAETVKAAKVESERRLRASGKVLALAERLIAQHEQRRADRIRAAAIRAAKRKLGLPID